MYCAKHVMTSINYYLLFTQLLCGIPIYTKFAGAAVNVLKRWLKATEIGDEYLEQKYLEDLSRIRLPLGEPCAHITIHVIMVGGLLRLVNSTYSMYVAVCVRIFTCTCVQKLAIT